MSHCHLDVVFSLSLLLYSIWFILEVEVIEGLCDSKRSSVVESELLLVLVTGFKQKF